jgi:hypothetical protein
VDKLGVVHDIGAPKRDLEKEPQCRDDEMILLIFLHLAKWFQGVLGPNSPFSFIAELTRPP